MRNRLVGMTNNESSGCIDCVGGAVDRADGHAAGEVRRVGADVAEIGGRVRSVVPLPELHLQLDVALVGVAGRLLRFDLMGRKARHHHRGEDAENH